MILWDQYSPAALLEKIKLEVYTSLFTTYVAV